MAEHAATSSRNVVVTNGESKSSSLGGFFKRLSSPKFHRSRSKSPMTNGDRHGKNNKSSWVTVEIKNGCEDFADKKITPVETTSPSMVVRSGTDGQLSSTATSCSTSSVPGSPMSSSSLHNGFTSPSRVRSPFGNLFHRGSFKKNQQKSATLQLTKDGLNSSNVDYDSPRTRTQSQHELTDERRISTTKSSTTVAASAKSKFDAFIAQLSHKNSFDGHRGDSAKISTQSDSIVGGGGRTALSEENLVSKSLVCETSTICLSTDPVASTTAIANGVVTKFQTNCLSSSVGYHSQDSVFDSPPNNAARVPSYVRLSCTLSGYKNYRNVDLRTPSPVRLSPLMPRIVENFPSNPSADESTQNNFVAHHHQLPAGKSLVERRLEKFQALKNDDKKVNGATYEPQTPETSATTVNGATPTPIRDIISNFNKLNLNDTPKCSSSTTTMSTPVAAPRPRQKPPPVPPRFDSKLDDQTTLTSENSNYSQSNGLHEQQFVRRENGSLLNEVLSAAAAVDDSTTNNTNLFSDVVVECFATIESNSTSTMNCNSEAINAVVVEPVNGYANKRFVTQQNVCRTTIVDDDDDVESTTTKKNTSVVAVAASSTNGVLNDRNESLMNGHDYRSIAKQHRQRLEKLLHDAENDLADEAIPEHAAEKLRIAVGKLKLLLRKKFATFEELIDKNLNPIPDDPRPTLDCDLAGYYQLVSIELDDIDNCYEVVERLRSNGWRRCESDDAVDSAASTKKENVKKTMPIASKSTSNVAAASKAKEAARQRLKDAKNAAMERKKVVAIDDDVQFFGP